jgi:hypothetical protein
VPMRAGEPPSPPRSCSGRLATAVPDAAWPGHERRGCAIPLDGLPAAQARRGGPAPTGRAGRPADRAVRVRAGFGLTGAAAGAREPGDVVGSRQLRQQSVGIGVIAQLVERGCRPGQRRACDDRIDLAIEGMAELSRAPSGPAPPLPGTRGHWPPGASRTPRPTVKGPVRRLYPGPVRRRAARRSAGAPS